MACCVGRSSSRLHTSIIASTLASIRLIHTNSRRTVVPDVRGLLSDDIQRPCFSVLFLGIYLEELSALSPTYI